MSHARHVRRTSVHGPVFGTTKGSSECFDSESGLLGAAKLMSGQLKKKKKSQSDEAHAAGRIGAGTILRPRRECTFIAYATRRLKTNCLPVVSFAFLTDGKLLDDQFFETRKVKITTTKNSLRRVNVGYYIHTCPIEKRKKSYRDGEGWCIFDSVARIEKKIM